MGQFQNSKKLIAAIFEDLDINSKNSSNFPEWCKGFCNASIWRYFMQETHVFCISQALDKDSNFFLNLLVLNAELIVLNL